MATPANPMTLGNIGPLLDNHPIDASAPCRIDFGGTLDISSFHYPLRHLAPSTVNIALDRRTTVNLRPITESVMLLGFLGLMAVLVIGVGRRVGYAAMGAGLVPVAVG